MSFGKLYASAYDGLYEEKPYGLEADFVLKRLGAMHNGVVQSILELGCGTGRHAIEFAKTVQDVCGLDFSADMVDVARRRRKSLPSALQERLTFQQGDARSVNLGRTFDAVVLLFHVMSYMATEADYLAALRTARRHLCRGGVLLFDFWYGPAVLKCPPQRRERSVFDNNRGVQVVRRTDPYWDKQRNLVNVRYEMIEKDQKGSEISRGVEEHILRYFFDEEIASGLASTGFNFVEVGEWLTAAPPTENSFGVFAGARAQ